MDLLLSPSASVQTPTTVRASPSLFLPVSLPLPPHYSPSRLPHLVPAGLSAAGEAPVHDVVCHEEERLQPLHAPSEHTPAAYLARQSVGKAPGGGGGLVPCEHAQVCTWLGKVVLNGRLPLLLGHRPSIHNIPVNKDEPLLLKSLAPL